MCRPKTKWESSIEFHGHECLGIAIGFRQAIHAMELLGVQKDGDEDLFAIVETDACGVDAIQVLTGCTLGKGNLIYKDTGKMAMTLANRSKDKAVRIILKPNAIPEDEQFNAIRQKIVLKKATEEEEAKWAQIQKDRVEKFLSFPIEQLFKVEEVAVPSVEKARLFQTLICSRCEEPFSEAKARLAEGKIYCSECYSDYSRGW